MLDRQKVEAILRRRFNGATDQQVAAAANALMALHQETAEISNRRRAAARRPGVASASRSSPASPKS